MERDVKGVARKDFWTPCVGCGRRIMRGQVYRLVQAAARPGWWHEACRAEYRATL